MSAVHLKREHFDTLFIRQTARCGVRRIEATGKRTFRHRSTVSRIIICNEQAPIYSAVACQCAGSAGRAVRDAKLKTFLWHFKKGEKTFSLRRRLSFNRSLPLPGDESAAAIEGANNSKYVASNHAESQVGLNKSAGSPHLRRVANNEPEQRPVVCFV